MPDSATRRHKSARRCRARAARPPAPPAATPPRRTPARARSRAREPAAPPPRASPTRKVTRAGNSALLRLRTLLALLLTRGCALLSINYFCMLRVRAAPLIPKQEVPQLPS